MDNTSLTALARELAGEAQTASSGRAARTVYGGHGHLLRHTMIALANGCSLDEHENPGEATVQVIRGRVRVDGGGDSWEGAAGHLLAIPPCRHSLHALEDSVVVLTAVLVKSAPSQDAGGS